MAIDFHHIGVPCQRSSSGPDIVGLHPEFRLRLWRALSDNRLSGSAVYSGRRSIAHQRKLYNAYLARGKTHPVVAYPGRSLHNEKPAGFAWGNLTFEVPWAIAADISFAGRPSSVVDPIMQSYGLHRIKSETWHWQINKTGTIEVMVGQGSRGVKAKKLQQRLNSLTGTKLDADGIYGQATAKAVIAFQRAHKLPARGDWTKLDELALARAARTDNAPARSIGAPKEDADANEQDALRRIRTITNEALRDG